MTNATLLSFPLNAIHDYLPRSSIPCCITLLAVFPKATMPVPPGLYSLPTSILLAPHTDFDALSLFFVSVRKRWRILLLLVSLHTPWKHRMSICWSMDFWQVDLISSSFIPLPLKPKIRIIPVFFSSTEYEKDDNGG